MGVWRRLAAVGVVWALGWGCGARVEAQRLPGGVRPEHYSLRLEPDLKAATFTGRETIEVVLSAPTREITLNAAEIDFDEVKAYVIGGASAEAGSSAALRNDKQKSGQQQGRTGSGKDGPEGGGAPGLRAEVTQDARREQASFHFGTELPAGRVQLAIVYRGILNDKLRGFYLSKTKLRSYAVTQFESTDARRAFPSFDEPALKATFDVTLVVDAGDTAISNMKMVSDTPGPALDKHTIAFATTPKMSTYLVAFLVGDFVCSEGKADGVPIRACATPDKAKLTKYPLDAAKFLLHYYDRYFGIKYPLAKLDLVAIPDFEAGAMENFGCITFRETELLVDAKSGATPAKMEVAETVAHEMAHQWFGDLVTPQWWDNLWLNEGFATWMETKAAGKWHPKWRFAESYAENAAADDNGTMDEDAGRTTRAIRARVETPAEINELFDDIAYGKAGAVIGMVEQYTGEEVFRRGVQAYLAAHLYGSATAEDFWSAQAKTSGLPVDAVMRSFVEQPGVPLVTFGERDGSGIGVKQERFLLAGSSEGAGKADAREAWTIPVCFKGAPCALLKPETKELEAGASAPFLYANAEDKGYYRTQYAPGELKAIAANAETGLTAPERIGLLGDRWALMRAGAGEVGEFLDLVLAMKGDRSAMVLDSSLGRMATIEAQIASDEDKTRLDAVVRREFAPVYAALSGAGRHESYDHSEMRGVLFEGLGRAGDPAALAEAGRLTAELLAGKKPSDPALVDDAVALTVVRGDEAMYDKMQRVAQNASDPDLKEDALLTLTRFQTPLLVVRTLEYAVSDQVRSQDGWTLIALLLERRATQALAWQWVKQHWVAIQKRSTTNSGARIVEAAGAFCTVAERDEVASFFAGHPVESSERTLAKSIDRINDCIQLQAAQEPKLRAWLDGQQRR